MQELDDEGLLLKLPLLRLGTEGAAAIEVGGDIVRSTVGAPGKLPKAPNARASSHSANTAIQRQNPTLQRDSPIMNFKKTHFLNFEVRGSGCDFSSVSFMILRDPFMRSG